MPKHLFPRFLIDAEEYSRARQFWKDMCEEVLQHSLSKDIWHEWFNTKAADGTELKDGNPIFSLVCERQAKGVSIHQEPLDEHQSKVAIYARLREFGSNSLQQPI